MMKRISTILLLLAPVALLAQFPNNPVKQKLGTQTTALGLVSYGDTIPLHTPASWRNDAELHADTTNDLTWKWTGYNWRLLDEVRRVTAPPATVTAGGNTLDYRYATWWRDTDSTYFQFNWKGSCWQPITAYRGDTIPDDIAALGSSAAVCFTYSDWYNTANDSLYFYVDGAWLATSGASIVDSTRLTQDSILVYFQNGSEIGRDTIVGTGGSGSGSTNLSYTASPTGGTVTSDTGTDATIPAGSTTNASLMLPGDKTKLDGIETGATADQTASEVPIADVGGNFVSTDVEGALNENATNIFALDAIVASKLDTVVVISLNDSTFVAHNYAGGSIVRSDTIAISGTGGGGLSGSIAENQIAYGDASGDITGSANLTRLTDGLLFDGVSNLRFTSSGGVVIGETAANSTGSGYFAMGFNSSPSNLTGSGWVSIGLESAKSATGSNYVVIGREAAENNTNLAGSVIIGQQAAQLGTNFDNNVVIGTSAGRQLTGGDAVIIGGGAAQNNATGRRNVIVGYAAAQTLSAGGNATDFTQGVYIGRSTRVGAAGAENEIVIGDLTYGNGTNTVTIGNSSISTNYFRDQINVTGDASLSLNAHTSTPTVAPGVAWVNTTKGWLLANAAGTEFQRPALVQDVAPTNGQRLSYNSTNSRWEPVGWVPPSDMNYTLNGNRTAAAIATMNYESFHATAAAAANYVLTLPTPSASLVGKQIVIYSKDDSGTYDLSATAGTDAIRDQLVSVTSLTLGNGETNILACMQTGTTTYKWVLIGTR